jgi:hypothetical protein
MKERIENLIFHAKKFEFSILKSKQLINLDQNEIRGFKRFLK